MRAGHPLRRLWSLGVILPGKCGAYLTISRPLAVSVQPAWYSPPTNFRTGRHLQCPDVHCLCGSFISQIQKKIKTEDIGSGF